MPERSLFLYLNHSKITLNVIILMGLKTAEHVKKDQIVIT